jgi:hypothetical protein
MNQSQSNTEPARRRFRIRQGRWLLAGVLLLAVAGLGIRLAVGRTQQFYRITGQLRQRGVGVCEGRPEWMHSLNAAGVRFSNPYTDALQLDGVADGDLQLVAEMTHLQWLRLDSNAVTDAGLVRIRPLTGLQCLHLVSGNITDSGLLNLQGLCNLETLTVWGPITDAGLESLYGLTKLKHLGLESTKVTPAGIAKLKAALPRVTVEVK